MTAEKNSDPHEQVVYHYCDANALLSILDRRKLWYTPRIHRIESGGLTDV